LRKQEIEEDGFAPRDTRRFQAIKITIEVEERELF